MSGSTTVITPDQKLLNQVLQETFDNRDWFSKAVDLGANPIFLGFGLTDRLNGVHGPNELALVSMECTGDLVSEELIKSLRPAERFDEKLGLYSPKESNITLNIWESFKRDDATMVTSLDKLFRYEANALKTAVLYYNQGKGHYKELEVEHELPWEERTYPRRVPKDNIDCPRAQKKTRSEAPSRHPFACPLWAAYKERYAPNSICASRGWMEIPRLKEHLYRFHYQTSCDRCLETFKQDKDLVVHRRQAIPCQRKDNRSRDPVVQGIGQDTMSMLKSRKRSSCQNAEEKWFEIWDIMFPHRGRPDTSYNLDVDLMPRSVAAPTLDCESPSSWWDSFAEHLSSSLQDSLCSKYNPETEELRDLVKYHIQKAIGKCLDRYPVIQFQGVDSQQTIPHEKANLLRIIPHGTNGPYSNFPTPERLFGKDRLSPIFSPLVTPPSALLKPPPSSHLSRTAIASIP
ncbi:uncharacterized protein PG986_014382 [Apiospora aurea]|uniref:C2H2-type domain-containing protein n=1 Tax=Apiospora aurea TaxID=335848 RepID=A0ABR1PSU3_9PEZI